MKRRKETTLTRFVGAKGTVFVANLDDRRPRPAGSPFVGTHVPVWEVGEDGNADTDAPGRLTPLEGVLQRIAASPELVVPPAR